MTPDPVSTGVETMQEWHIHSRSIDEVIVAVDQSATGDGGLTELAAEIAKDWNGRPDVCPRCGHSAVGCVAPFAELRAMLPPCRPPHGSLDDLLFGDATIEEQRAARLATPEPIEEGTP